MMHHHINLGLDNNKKKGFSSSEDILCSHGKQMYVAVAFASLVRIWGKCLTTHSLLHLFFFFKWKLDCTLIPLSRPGLVHSRGSSSWDNSGRVFPAQLHVSLFPDRFPHYACGIISPLRLCWVQGVCMFRRHLPPALLAEWLGPFMCHCSNTGWNGHQIRVSSQSQLWRRKFSRRSCQDLNSQPFGHESSTLPANYPGSL